VSDDFYIATPPTSERIDIVRRPRVGVDYAGAWATRLLRFYIKGNSFVSKK
jgi:DNA-3-methyladenine glycosylase